MSDLIQLCARLSAAVYNGFMPDDLGIWHWQRISCEQTDTFAIACVTQDAVIIAVQGSESRRDWLNNFRIIKTEYHGIKAHKGFAWAAESILADVLKVISREPGKQIIFTGHSLGGAIATLLAVAMRPLPVKVITFGAPRVSTKRELNLALYGEYVRVVNGSDVVPRSPWLAYSHAGTLVYLSNSGKHIVDANPLTMFWDRLPTIFDRATDHSMRHYLQELTA